MAGILANSASVTMSAGSPDAVVAGFVSGERIVLTTTPTGATYQWAMARPSGAAKAALDDDTAAGPTFVPDVAGYYTLTVLVDSVTTYVLRVSVTATAMGTTSEALRFQPKTDASIAAPALGMAMFWSDDHEGLAAKFANGAVVPLRPGIVGAGLTDADQTIQIGEGVHRVQSAAITANRAKTLGTTGAALGHVLELHRFDGAAFTLAVVNGGPGAGTLLTFPSGERHSAVFRFDGTNWALSERRRLV